MATVITFVLLESSIYSGNIKPSLYSALIMIRFTVHLVINSTLGYYIMWKGRLRLHYTLINITHKNLVPIFPRGVKK